MCSLVILSYILLLYFINLINSKLNLSSFQKINYHTSGLPHTQGTQGIQGNSGNFQVEENLRETQGILIYFFKLRETQGSCKILKILRNFFAIFRMRF